MLSALNRNKNYIRGEVAHAVNLKFAPDIRFLRDETFEEASRIDQLLATPKVAQDVEGIARESRADVPNALRAADETEPIAAKGVLDIMARFGRCLPRTSRHSLPSRLRDTVRAGKTLWAAADSSLV